MAQRGGKGILRWGGGWGELVLMLLVLAGVWYTPFEKQLTAPGSLSTLSGTGYLYSFAQAYIPQSVKVWLSLAGALLNSLILRNFLLRYLPGLTRSYLPLLLCPLLSLGGAYAGYDILPPVLAFTLLLWIVALLQRPLHEGPLQDRWLRMGLLFGLTLLLYPGCLLLVPIPWSVLAMNRKGKPSLLLTYTLGLAVPLVGAWAILEWLNLRGMALIPSWEPERLGRLTDHIGKGSFHIVFLGSLLMCYLITLLRNIRDPFSRKRISQRVVHIARMAVLLLLLTLYLLPYPSGITVLLGNLLGIALTVHFARASRPWLNAPLLLALLSGAAYCYYV